MARKTGTGYNLSEFLPLALFSVLGPGVVGAFAVLQMTEAPPSAGVGVLVAAGLAMGITLSHLGHPQRFYRVTGNIFRSWLSREAFLFGGFTGLAGLHWLLRQMGIAPAAASFCAGMATALGLLTVAATARVYAIPTRPAWSHWTGQILFGFTLLTLGPVLADTFLLAALRLTATTVTTAAISFPVALLRAAFPALGGLISLRRWQYLQAAGVLAALGIERWYGAVMGMRLLLGVLLPAALLIYGLGAGHYPVWAVALSVLAGEVTERLLFFRAVIPVSVEGEIDRVRQKYMKIPAEM
ncbi:MAG: dimethyl sulfoxide reductase anchor subunit family protein [bacterium]